MERQDRYWFHPDHAPEGRLFRAAEADPTGKGWVTTPAAFDPAYVAPPPDPPELQQVPGLPPRQPRVLFPSWRFHKTSGEARLMQSAAEAGELGAEWSATPADVEPAPAETPLTPTGEARRAEFFALTVAEITTCAAATDDLALLDLWRSFESHNPKGARKGVLAALANRVNELE